MDAKISSAMICLGMRSSRRRAMASAQPSSETVSSSSRRTEKRTFSLMPYSLGSKETNRDMSTMSLENTFRVRPPSRARTAWLTPWADSSLAWARVRARQAWPKSPGEGIGNGLCQDLTRQAGPDVHLLVKLIPAHLGHVVTPGVEEQGVHISLGIFHCGRLAGAQAAVNLQEALLPGLAGVLLQGGADEGILPNSSWILASVSIPRARIRQVIGSLRFLSMRT